MSKQGFEPDVPIPSPSLYLQYTTLGSTCTNVLKKTFTTISFGDQFTKVNTTIFHLFIHLLSIWKLLFNDTFWLDTVTFAFKILATKGR